MLLFLVAYLAGVLTIVSPCILPVLPFVFARADRPFLRGGLPLLVGLAASFAAVSTLAAVGGGWAVEANRYGRGLAAALLALFGLALLLPGLGAWLAQPLVDLGARLSRSAAPGTPGEGGVASSVVLGVATGLLWTPCAGPVLGLILAGAALQGVSVRASLLLFAYAAGAATSLALALLAGGRVLRALKRSLAAGEWVRRGVGAVVLLAVAAIALGLDTGFLTRLSAAGTTALEERLLARLPAAPPTPPPAMAMAPAMTGPAMTGPAMTGAGPAMTAGDPGAMMMSAKPAGGAPRLSVQGQLPSLDGATLWLNSPPLTTAGLKGHVVLVDFWTYSCINCLRALPYVRAWAEKYADQGLVVIGVHAPEFAFEKDAGNVRRAVEELGLRYPVALDNDYALWRAFDNRYWPAHYFADAEGRLRHRHFGEGGYDESERVIQALLAEAGRAPAAGSLVAVAGSGVEAPAQGDVQSPETYVGYERAERFVSPGGAVQDRRHVYAPGEPRLNEWGLAGDWTVGKEHAALNAPGGGVVYRFHARDLHLVLAAPAGRKVRFQVTLDGAPPGDGHGADADADGAGVVTGQRLYQLVRQPGAVGDRTFEIRFLDPGARVYAFTFG